jgi:hypothetical protein
VESTARVSQVLNVLQLVGFDKESMRLSAGRESPALKTLLLLHVTKTPHGVNCPCVASVKVTAIVST